MRALLLAALAATAAAAQPVDTLAVTPVIADSAQARSPRGAVTRALLVPGLGQLYNRQPAKAPVAAALVGGAAVYAVIRQRRYIEVRRATVYAGCTQDVIPDTREEFIEVCTEVAPDYQDEWEALGSKAFGTLRVERDRARGQRDVGALVVLVAYAVQALDAYVYAELADFDVSEDLGVRLDPGPGPPTLSVRVRL